MKPLNWIDRADLILEYYPEHLLLDKLFGGYRRFLSPRYWKTKTVVSLIRLAVWLAGKNP